MKKTILFVSTIAIALVSTLFSCVESDKNLYDASFKMPNPMGEGFSAPDGFDWSTTTSRTFNVEVKDEFSELRNKQGQEYYYKIEFYDENPLYNNDAILLGTGVARKDNNLVTSINLSKNQKGVYIKQIDPKNRVEVYLCDIPENNDNIDCKLYYSNTQNNSSKVRSLALTKEVTFEKPNYTSVPSDAEELSQVQGVLQPNKAYKISSPYNGTFTFSGNNGSNMTRLYITSTWTIPQSFTFQNGIEIIVMPNGKIESSNGLTFVNTSFMTIMDSGNVKSQNITFTDAQPAGLRNWGTISIENKLALSSSASLYNKGAITCKEFGANSSSKIVNDYKINITNDLDLPSSFTLENNGELTAKKLTVSSESVITNNGKMNFESISWTNGTVYNNCNIEATSSLYLNGAKLTFNKGYLKASTIKTLGGFLSLDNGSMLEATRSSDLQETKFTGISNTTSMIKSPTIEGQGFIYDGNLAIESNNHVTKNPYWDNFTIRNGANITKIGESKVTIETCSGTINEGNQGGDPGSNIPSFPIIMDDNQNYAYMYEDQWPLYGDYDMNDIVMVINKRKLSVNKKNLVEKFELSIDLCAVGATKKLGAAIMLDGVKASEIKTAVKFEDNNLINSFNLNDMKIEKGQDFAVIPLFDDAHIALGRARYEAINTSQGSPNNTEYKTINFTIEFNTPTLSADAFNINKLNLFIFNNLNRDVRREIHVTGFQPTKLAETDIFGNNNDNSSVSNKKYYISKENLAWGIMVPTNFKWPKEYVNIRNAYPEFESWVTSGGKENDKWWNGFDVDKVFQTNKN